MALPHGFLDDLRNRLSLSDIAGRKLIWDAKKSNPAKGDFWAPCCFHQEKTPSLHIDDRKGFYYCFGCHAKGDMITFVRETENVSFIEAVEILAREAGVDMPEQTRDPKAAEKRERAQVLADVMEQSVKAFGLAFRSAGAAQVRDYAQGRGLTGETAKRFEIGFAPDSRTQLTNYFKEKGLLDEAIAAGMIIKPDNGGAPYDRFRNRLMFPIRDPRGRCIAFGGRAMDPNARAKYLNSPTTELFDKSRTLYNYGPAREAAGKAQALIVAEGYMDVIALAQAGFGHSVAPNGTAVTEHQLAMMWKVADEPVIALDGDKAGLRAAERLLDLALPMLAPGKSLKFCLMPEGRDPDDLIKAGGPAAMQAALDDAVPLIEMLWRRETAQSHDTPEQRAALDQRLKETLSKISNTGVRNHYAADLRARRAELFRPPQPKGTPGPGGGMSAGRRWPGPGGRRRNWPARPTRETLGSELGRRSAAADAEARIRESTILLIALNNPAALTPVEQALDAMTFVGAETGAVRDALMDRLAEGGDLAPDEEAIAQMKKVPGARTHPLARPGADPERVALVLDESIRRHQAQLSHSLEIGEARRDVADADHSAWAVRVADANREKLAADQAASVILSEKAEEETGSVFQRMLDNETWKRQRNRS